MRILFVGLNDNNGWMYEYSKLLNKYTDIVSNCILYKDVCGYGADIVLKSIKDTFSTEDKIDLTVDFAKDTDIFIFNGCDIQRTGFKYGRIEWGKYMKGKLVYFFVGDAPKTGSLFSMMPEVMTITNQPKVYHDFCFSRNAGLALIQPMLATDMEYTDGWVTKKANSVLYRDEGEVKLSTNLETFLMIFSFLFNEFDNVEYVSTRGKGYPAVRQCLQNFNYSFDMISPVGIYSRASIEAACMGMINFVAMPHPYSQLFMQSIDSNELYFDSVLDEKELYEKAKFYFVDQAAREMRQGKVMEWAKTNFQTNRIQQLADSLLEML